MDNCASSRLIPETHTRIFIVENDQAIQELLTTALEMIGHYAVFHVTHGNEALQVVTTLHPDLFLLDYHLPDMTGLQLYDRLHAEKTYTRIPTILMSARLPSAAELEKRRLFGLSKPFCIKQLLELINFAIYPTCVFSR